MNSRSSRVNRALRISVGLAGSMALAIGCNVSSAPSSTGGVTFDGPGGSAGAGNIVAPAGDANVAVAVAGGGNFAGAGSSDVAEAPNVAGASSMFGTTTALAPQPVACDRGIAVVTSDYKSTNIAVSKLDGTTLSGSFVSSGATKPGLALAISGDVDVPLVAPASKRVVILDRYGNNVITWMDLSTATVLAQLPVGTGFESNPQDYLEIDATYAYVSRFGANFAPGAQAHDSGSDVLIIDTKTPTIVGSIPIPESDPALLSRPDFMNWVGPYAVLTLSRVSADFATVGDGRFLGISPSTHQIAWQVDITGLNGCGRVVVSPSRKLIAIACSGKRDSASKQYDLASSDIVIYDATTIPPTELRRLHASTQLNSGIQPSLAFASENTLLAKTYGGNATPGDHVFSIDVVSSAITDLGAVSKPYQLGSVYCSPGCGGICLLSDAERSKLRRWSVSETGVFTALDDVAVDTVVGLPPRSIGGL